MTVLQILACMKADTFSWQAKSELHKRERSVLGGQFQEAAWERTEKHKQGRESTRERRISLPTYSWTATSSITPDQLSHSVRHQLSSPPPLLSSLSIGYQFLTHRPFSPCLPLLPALLCRSHPPSPASPSRLRLRPSQPQCLQMPEKKSVFFSLADGLLRIVEIFI